MRVLGMHNPLLDDLNRVLQSPRYGPPLDVYMTGAVARKLMRKAGWNEAEIDAWLAELAARREPEEDEECAS